MKLSPTLGFLALLFVLGLTPAYSQIPVLGVSNLVAGPAGGLASVTLGGTASAWTAGANASWLHVTAGSQNGVRSTNIFFSLDKNNGGTRSGTLTIAGQTLTVTQAGPGYVPASAKTALVAAGLANPSGVAADSLGNVYIADTGNNTIREWVAASNTVATLVSAGLNAPSGVAVDEFGNVYIADTGNNLIKEWVAASHMVITLVSAGLNTPSGVAVDRAGNVYVADTFNNAIKEWLVAGNTVTNLVNTGLNGPYGLAVDVAGNVYIADTFNDAVKEWVPGGGVRTLVASGLAWPTGVSVDGSGNVQIANYLDSKLQEWLAVSNSLITLAGSGLNNPQGVAVDAAGNIYVADTGFSTIVGLPRVWVNPAARAETADAGSDQLPPVLPAAFNLNGPFAPVSDAAWVTITGVTNGVVGFTFSSLPSAGRAAHINLLGQSIAVTQTGPLTTTVLGSLVAATYGDNLIFSAAVTPVPTDGTVQFYTNGVALGLPVPVTNGLASYATSDLGAGSDLVTAAFGGSPGFAASVSEPSLQTVTPVVVTITSGVTADNKTYDATETATIRLDNVSLNGVFAGDQGGVSLSTNGSSATFASPGVANGLVVTVNGLTLTGAAAVNYTLVQPSLLANITRATPVILSIPVASSLSYGQTLVNSTLVRGLASVAGTFAFAFPDTIPNAGLTSVSVMFSPFDTTNYNNVTIKVNVNVLSDQAVLGATQLLTGPGGGVESVVLAAGSAWTAGANAGWLHLRAGSQSGFGNTNIIFEVDPNIGGTRTGSLTIAGQTLSVVQAGLGYVAATPYTALVTGGLSNPGGVAVDNLGNVYIADTANNAIREWVAASNIVVTLVNAGLSSPAGVAVDNLGNVYIADTGNNAVKEWVAANQTVTTLASTGLNAPGGVAVDGAGNVYIADTFNNAIKEQMAGGGALLTLVGAGLNGPYGVAVDLAGNVYVADTFNGAVKEWLPAGGVRTLAGGLGWPTGVAVDGFGNVHIADYLDSKLLKWVAASNAVVTRVGSGLNHPQGVAVDTDGNVYMADTGSSVVTELPQAWVNPGSLLEPMDAGNDQLPSVLPETLNLNAPFVPSSDSSWLTINGVTNGMVSYAFTTLPNSVRTAHIILLGQSIAITQIAPPTTTTLGTPATVAYGDTLTLSATVTPVPVGGAVQFYTNGVALGFQVPVNNGLASFASSDLGAGNYLVTAAFGGAPGFAASVSDATQQMVVPAAVTIASGVSAENKTYNALTVATIRLVNAVLSGILARDENDVQLSTNAYAATFASPSVGYGVAVTVSGLALTGAAARNYTLTQPLLLADITPALPTAMLVSSENPAGFNDNLSFTASLPPSATGQVVFLTNGIILGTSTLDGGLAVSPPTRLLPVGTNLIALQYAGDMNYLGITNAMLQIVTNYPPVAQPMTVLQRAGLTIRIALSDMATNWSDPQGYPVILTAVNLLSTNGLPVQLINLQTNADGSFFITNTAFLEYSNPAGVNDQITYAISDGQGATATGLINLVTSTIAAFGPATIYPSAGNGITVSFTGQPDTSYSVQRSTNFTAWLTLWTTNAPATGIFDFTDRFGDLGGNAPDAAYYRLGLASP